MECWQKMPPAYRRRYPALSDRNRHFRECYNKARAAAGLGAWPQDGNLILARQQADFQGVPYEVFTQALQAHYKEANNANPKIPAFPEPSNLKTNKAATIFGAWESEIAAGKSPWVLDMVPPFDTFDPDDPVHLEHCRWVWKKIGGACSLPQGGFSDSGLSRAAKYIADALGNKLLHTAGITHSTVGMPLYIQANALNEQDRRKELAEADSRGETERIDLPGTDRFEVVGLEALPGLGEESKDYHLISEQGDHRLVEMLGPPASPSVSAPTKKSDAVGPGGGDGDNERSATPVDQSPSPAAQPEAPTCFGCKDCGKLDQCGNCDQLEACVRKKQQVRRAEKAEAEAPADMSLEELEAHLKAAINE
ncbi:MAG: hypothetical protein K9K66_07590 [Desulfarculaceae bacterium]|nr:hypothetical protein [Desulfarculaceae bacterium]MCF8071987.1 hypothetical protein [Desulfarculaceae bacterium]MCF8101504.1 hypothetical protein [Desulfarculaceae bacterium]MCF8115054.1 hypothetical protein [Desulfarculaceae bacterium]